MFFLGSFCPTPKLGGINSIQPANKSFEITLFSMNSFHIDTGFSCNNHLLALEGSVCHYECGQRCVPARQLARAQDLGSQGCRTHGPVRYIQLLLLFFKQQLSQFTV